MPQPYNYSLNVPNPADALTKGLQTGVQIGEVQAQTQARNAATQAAQAKAARQQEFQQALTSVGKDPSAKQLSGLLVQFPEMSNLFKESYDQLDKTEQQERTSQASSVYSAVLAGDNDLAKKQLGEYAAAYRNAGREDDAKALEAKAKLIDLHPEAAEKGISLWLAQAMGPEKFAETFGKLQDDRRKTATEGADLTKAEAEAQSAVVKSKWAESDAVRAANLSDQQLLNLQLEPEFKRANLRILTLQAQQAKETNTLKREELQSKLDDAQLARDEKLRTRVDAARTGAADLDSFISSIDDVLKQPTGFFSGANSATGPVFSKVLTLDSRTSDYEEMIQGLGSKAFLTKIASLRGTGPISNIEGEKAQKALANLDLRQSLPQLVKNLNIARDAVLKMRGEIETRYGVPTSTPDTPAAALDPNGDDTNALVRAAQSGGSTARY